MAKNLGLHHRGSTVQNLAFNNWSTWQVKYFRELGSYWERSFVLTSFNNSWYVTYVCQQIMRVARWRDRRLATIPPPKMVETHNLQKFKNIQILIVFVLGWNFIDLTWQHIYAFEMGSYYIQRYHFVMIWHCGLWYYSFVGWMVNLIES